MHTQKYHNNPRSSEEDILEHSLVRIAWKLQPTAHTSKKTRMHFMALPYKSEYLFELIYRIISGWTKNEKSVFFFFWSDFSM